MTTYAVGDIQGCFEPFQRLLANVRFNPAIDTLWSVGDLVNRGDDNLSTLRWFHQHRKCVKVVLGNHDLHLIAAAAGVKKLGRSDNLHDILEAPDADKLINWLRKRPLLHKKGKRVMTHAGIPSVWSVKQARRYASEVEVVLQSKQRKEFLRHMYGNEPARFSEHLRGMARLRVITNTFTRMRYATASGYLDFTNKGPIVDEAGSLSGESLRPWFRHRKPKKHTLIFGHWAALEGKTDRKDIIGLDTGCVWGGPMTLLNLDTGQRFEEWSG
jgi:bis(5'-nucleosyl)-tetraphosphatase (symmetrical)